MTHEEQALKVLKRFYRKELKILKNAELEASEDITEHRSEVAAIATAIRLFEEDIERLTFCGLLD